MTRLAYFVRIQGQKDEAIELYKRAEKLCERTLGVDDKMTGDCATCVTDTLAEKMSALEKSG